MRAAPRYIVAPLALLAGLASACPGIDPPPAAGTLLALRGATTADLAAADLARLPPIELLQRRSVGAAQPGASTPPLEQSVRYGGVLLRDVLAPTMRDPTLRRALRAATVEAVATDGYRASFSWGELYNSSAGEQVLVILAQDGRPLDAEAGPLALRALADLRPGPRHVRNLCGLSVRWPEALR